MRRTLATVLFVALAATLTVPACTLDSSGAGADSNRPDAAGGGDGGSTDGDADSGPIPIPDAGCFPGTKACGEFCVDVADPAYGCSPTACSACVVSNAVAACDGPACAVGTCLAPFVDCNNDPQDGCESNLMFDPVHCGDCATNCIATFGTSYVCTDGECRVSNCPSGTADCDRAPGNACEIVVDSDVANCGFCTNQCNIPNTVEECVGGQCAIDRCTGDFEDCNDVLGDGCEIDTGSDTANCGVCGTVCNATNGTATCNGACGIACQGPFADCNGNLNDGCESNTATTLAHCGGCGQACGSARANPSCTGGQCNLNCDAGYANCDGSYPNGCEVSTLLSESHCGGCGMACSTVGGTPTCTSGTCTIACGINHANCNGNASDGCEVDIRVTVAHCGGCGMACSANNGTPSCSGGSCSIACNPGFENCDTNARANGCEINTGSSVIDCGGCNQVCSSNNGTPSCSSGMCGITCNSPYRDCVGGVADGCETNTSTSSMHCGMCNIMCTSPPTCSGGMCS